MFLRSVSRALFASVVGLAFKNLHRYGAWQRVVNRSKVQWVVQLVHLRLGCALYHYPVTTCCMQGVMSTVLLE